LHSPQREWHKRWRSRRHGGKRIGSCRALSKTCIGTIREPLRFPSTQHHASLKDVFRILKGQRCDTFYSSQPRRRIPPYIQYHMCAIQSALYGAPCTFVSTSCPYNPLTTQVNITTSSSTTHHIYSTTRVRYSQHCTAHCTNPCLHIQACHEIPAYPLQFQCWNSSHHPSFIITSFVKHSSSGYIEDSKQAAPVVTRTLSQLKLHTVTRLRMASLQVAPDALPPHQS
jgi:hypothetical protein